MKSLIVVSLLVCLTAGCAWQQSTKLSLDLAGTVADGAEAIGMPKYNTRCEATARTCGCAPKPAPCPCPQSDKCQADRRIFVEVLKSTHAARYVGYGAVLAGDKAKAEGVVATLKKLGVDIATALKELGVI